MPRPHHGPISRTLRAPLGVSSQSANREVTRVGLQVHTTAVEPARCGSGVEADAARETRAVLHRNRLHVKTHSAPNLDR